ncbi:NADH:ubiquinone reductase (Na(+)-transporting) subunit C [Chlamydia sp. 17-3921]|uniref:NADH:ubiquinone reductase (Na(+)-transporting) subunit C n=1 Tax=Chlamydia sp. 17-3921 TaxID=2675798 RepID=UPI0019191617|nr:NADH:ubiquinone reductase (Na(+)-transporting) subunit C [Chlamydia sp. 17-3921]
MSEESSHFLDNRKNQIWYVITFVLGLSLFASLLLSIIYTLLSPLQEQAKTFDRNKQLLIAAHILDFEGRFQLYENETWETAIYDKDSHLLKKNPGKASIASGIAVESYVQYFVRPLLANRKGEIFSFEDLNFNSEKFLEKLQEAPAHHQKFLLFYAILNNTEQAATKTNSEIAKAPEEIKALVIPISGFGLWGPIEGYLGIANDGNTVLGTTWYEQGETPGLGANIANPEWQKQFYGKKVFLQTNSETISLSQVPLGLEVIKGSVKSEFGNSPKSLSTIDGISGATLTCNGVTEAYIQSLAPYRSLLIYFSNLKASGKK